MADFLIAVAKVLAHEGGYTPGLPQDPGGETNFGISRRSYPQVDIRNLTRDAAIDLYRRDFWSPLRLLGGLHQWLGNGVLDFAVTSGVGRSVTELQRAINLLKGAGPSLPPDGLLGPDTQQAAAALDPDLLIRALTHRRIVFYHRLPTAHLYFDGWCRRALDW